MKFEVPYFNTANLTSLNDEETNNVSLNKIVQKHEPEEFEEIELESEMIKPLKKKQKVMNFNLFDDNKDEKSTSFINLVDDHVNVNTPHIIDLSDDNVDTKASKDTEKSTGDNKDDSYDNVILPAGAKELENVLHEKEEAVVSSDKSPSNTTNLSQKEDVSPITLNNQSNDLSDVESEKKKHHHQNLLLIL